MDNNFFDSLRKDFLKKAIYDILKTLLILVFTIASAYLGTEIISHFVAGDLAKYRWPIAIILGSGITLLILFLIRRFSSTIPHYPRVRPKFLILEKEIIFEYRSKTKMTYRRRYKLQALRDDLSTFQDKYRWTGSGTATLSTAIPEHRVQDTERLNVWQFYEVNFGRALQRGEIIEIEVVWQLEDPEEKAVHFCSATVDEPTKLLTMTLRIPPELGVRTVQQEVAMSIGARHIIQSESANLNRMGELSWRINKPRLLHYYEIRWDFPDQRA